MVLNYPSYDLTWFPIVLAVESFQSAVGTGSALIEPDACGLGPTNEHQQQK